MKPQVSLAVYGFIRLWGEEGALEKAAEIGLRYVDWDLSVKNCSKPDSVYYGADLDAIGEHYLRLKERADSLGIKFGQTHGRINAYHDDPEYDENELRGMRCDCMITKLLEAPYCVIHDVHLGIDAEPERQRLVNARMYDDFMPLAREYGIVVASETLGDCHSNDMTRSAPDFFGQKAEFIAAYDAVAAKDGNDKYLCACVDTGHTNKAHRFPGEPSAEEMILALGDKVKCLHLNDNDMMTDQHKVPLSGTIDWDAVMLALKKIGYGGTYNMEINLNHFGRDPDTVFEYARFSVQVMKGLINKFY